MVNRLSLSATTSSNVAARDCSEFLWEISDKGGVEGGRNRRRLNWTGELRPESRRETVRQEASVRRQRRNVLELGPGLHKSLHHDHASTLHSLEQREPAVGNPPAPLRTAGAPQWVSVDFPQPVRVSELHVQFQGGFSGKHCLLQGFVKDDPSKTLMEFYPEDVNSTQVFQVPPSEPIHKLKLILCSSTDLFGRIVIYRLDVRGEKA
uniref:Nuclear receptor 2C2-associated protein isoform X1 n=1 Tax=Petromyzon marinus TaxID=7757 RepID=A0AAJ7TXZ8_PETMA|nr:nuclear receptor 2C2-associated protein isoform X1 [Petromyzon marinus]